MTKAAEWHEGLDPVHDRSGNVESALATMPANPFRAERYDIGQLTGGRILSILPMTIEAAEALGPPTAAMDAWANYGFDAVRVTAAFLPARTAAIGYQVKCDDELVGGLVIISRWLDGPYLDMLAVLPCHQRQ